MAAQVRELVVFMASPGDLESERGAIRAVEDVVNHAFEMANLRVRVVGWELVTPEVGRPQELINPMVRTCDVFIGLLNRRWGSATGEFSSGFEEEFELALSRRADGGTPSIGMFFAEVPQDIMNDPGVQLTKVLEFKSRLRRERIVLYQEFRNSDHLSGMIQTFLVRHLLQEAAENARSEVQSSASASTMEQIEDVAAADRASHSDATAPSIDDARRQISQTLRAFDELARGESGPGKLDSDRLALIGHAFVRDQPLLGGHLVNRLYRRRDELHLSVPELASWRRTFFADIGQSNTASARTIPGWAVLDFRERQADEVEKDLLTGAVDEEVSVSRGAIRVMTRLRARPAGLWLEIQRGEGEMDARSHRLRVWMDLFHANPGVDAAFDYLISQFQSEDKAFLEVLVAEPDLDAKSREAVRALVASLNGDFTALAALAPSQYNNDAEHLVKFMIDHLAELSDDVQETFLTSGRIELRNATARQIVISDELNVPLFKEILRGADSGLVDLLLDQASSRPELGNLLLELVSSEEVKSKQSIDFEARLLAILKSPEELRIMHEASLLDYVAWHALLLQRPGESLEEARSVLDGDAAEFRGRISDLLKDHRNVVEFIAANVRLAACVAISADGFAEPADVARLAVEVERNHLVSRGRALNALAKVATEETVEVADGILTTLDDYGFLDGADDLLSTALGPILAERWKTSDVAGLRDAAHRWYLGRPERTADEIIDGTYDADARTRMQAVEALFTRLDNAQLHDLLEGYPMRRGEHWYNVVVALDEHLYGAEAYAVAELN